MWIVCCWGWNLSLQFPMAFKSSLTPLKREMTILCLLQGMQQEAPNLDWEQSYPWHHRDTFLCREDECEQWCLCIASCGASNVWARLAPFLWFMSMISRKSSNSKKKEYEQILLPTSRKVLSTFRKYFPVGFQSAQTVWSSGTDRSASRGHCAHARVKFLYSTATFHWGLKVATHCCVVVHLCFEISQTQLLSRGPSAHARCQVSEYSHLSLWPQDCNTVLQTKASAVTWTGPWHFTVGG